MPLCCLSLTTPSGSTGRRWRSLLSWGDGSSPTPSSSWLLLRDGYSSVLDDAGLPERRLAGLDDATAGELLDISAPQLSLAARDRVLREATGNPLALLELPAVVSQHEEELRAPGLLPLTERLERAFAARISELPDQTRLVLLVAALDDGDEIREILDAGSQIVGTTLGLEVLAPAVAAQVIEVDLHTLRFRHPLIRSALAQSAALGAGRSVHDALANVLADQPDRRAWHRAALLSGEHEEIALELEQAASRAQAQGAIAVAVSAMRRAALVGEPDRRSARLLSAARLAVELGRWDVVLPLLPRAQPVGSWRVGTGPRHVDRRDSRDPPARGYPAVCISDRGGRTSWSRGRSRPSCGPAVAGRFTGLVGRPGA